MWLLGAALSGNATFHFKVVNMFYLCDETLKILKVTESLEACFYWADILLPTSGYRVDEFSLPCLLKFQTSELKQMYTATTGDVIKSHVERTTLIGLILNRQEELFDKAPIAELHGRLGRTPSVPNTKALPQGEPAAQRAPRAASAASGAKVVGRPKPGTTTARVWDFCDSFLATNGKYPDRNELIAALSDVNPSTVGVQFSHWKRHQDNV